MYFDALKYYSLLIIINILLVMIFSRFVGISYSSFNGSEQYFIIPLFTVIYFVSVKLKHFLITVFSKNTAQ